MKKFLSGFLTTVMLAFVVSCGSNSNVLTGIQVSTQQVNNDTMLSFSANLNLGAMSFASISLPIIDPHGNGQIGQLELTSGLAGQSQIKISVDLNAVAGVNAAQAVLPNGNQIPLIANNPAIAINIGHGAKVYLTIGQGVAAIGVAVPIAAFDQIGSQLPGLNFFPVVQQGNVVATAGVFTGAQPGMNGIAVVADVSKVINLGNLIPSSQLMAKSLTAPKAMTLNYESHMPVKAQADQLKSMLATLNARKTKLKLH
ncbi:MAG: hypothetical protein ACJ76H_10455 [Bacteriovoracaceae bacterium]